ncbi:DEAD/DEAH box helicase [Pedobacter cryophilus]|uniref:DEAD-box ATP-dependent RNA helicase RhpA n=1 Tax=Pedobacter cryophilus TaxID=2571271 RepID=A0A4U1C917_9SPHI|nr:DEAD/DEAH box helicase [Pedobacter cryophilus]TKC00907.1 DEAD/DEAH box helicase [Pedobacter cryophilus]
MLFENLNLIEPILKALKTEGYTTPTPIQAQAIPLLLNRRDVLGCAQTGTGKTAAFAIPIIQLLTQDKNLKPGKRLIRSLILTPTRELAIQIGESFESYGRNTNLKYKVIFGGVNQHSQVESLRSGIDVLIATPGRLLDLMNQRHVHLNDIQFFVLDEADRMLDMGFVNDVKKVIAKLPAKRQSLFFSATMPPVIVQLADTILVNPAKVEVTPVSSTANTINQVVYFVDKDNKRHLLMDVLKDKSIERALVFTRTKHGADRVAKDLTKAGIHSQAIHGNKSQNARQAALTNFKAKVTRVLVATDIAARGIDIDELTHVVNYELPNVPESYVHRIGRTGRAGASGIAIAFCDAEEKEYLKDIQKLIGKDIPVIADHDYPLMNHNVVKAVKQARPPRGSAERTASRRPDKTAKNTSSAPKEKKKQWYK